MLTRLEAENFKSWQQTGEIRLSKITGLFGTNSSGKTSIIQLLLLLKQTAASTDRSQPLYFGEEGKGLVDLGDYPTIVYDHDQTKAISWSLSWTLDEPVVVIDTSSPAGEALFANACLGYKAAVRSESEKAGVPRIATERISYNVGDAEFGMRKKEGSSGFELFTTNDRHFSFVRTQGRRWDLPNPVKCYGFPDQVRAYFQNAGFLSDLELHLEQLLSNIYYLGPLRANPQRKYSWSGSQPASMGERGDQAISALLSSRDRGETISLGKGKKRQSIEAYIADWLKRLGLIHSFSVAELKSGSRLYEVRVKKTENSPEVLITDVGFGVSQILPVLVLCFYAPEGSTIVLEQPEIHLHPSVQAGLADVLLDSVAKRKTQIILESHSEHLLRRLQRRIAEDAIPSADVALYFCQNEGARSKVTPLALDMFGNITNWPDGFFGDDFEEMAAMAKAAQSRRTAQK